MAGLKGLTQKNAKRYILFKLNNHDPYDYDMEDVPNFYRHTEECENKCYFIHTTNIPTEFRYSKNNYGLFIDEAIYNRDSMMAIEECYLCRTKYVELTNNQDKPNAKALKFEAQDFARRTMIEKYTLEEYNKLHDKDIVITINNDTIKKDTPIEEVLESKPIEEVVKEVKVEEEVITPVDDLILENFDGIIELDMFEVGESIEDDLTSLGITQPQPQDIPVEEVDIDDCIFDDDFNIDDLLDF